MKCSVLIDWLSFTFKCEGFEENGQKYSSSWNDVLYVCENYLKISVEKFQNMGYSKYGYRDCVSYQGIHIYFNGNSLTMGVNISMSGNACRAFEAENPNYSLLNLCENLYDGYKNNEINITRIDIACDDKNNSLNLQTLKNSYETDAIRTKLRDYNLNDSKKQKTLNGKKLNAYTLYIGSEKSEFRFRIYDKAKQLGDYDSHWVRLEMVCRRDYARAAVEQLVTSGLDFGECVAGMVADKLSFIELDDGNISRCSLSPWWADFLESLRRVRLALKSKPDMTLDSLTGYFKDTLAACAYTLTEFYGKKFWDTVCELGRKKAGKRHRHMLEDALFRLVNDDAAV